MTRPDPLTILMDEYRTLRQESLQALQASLSILQFGVAGLGVLLGLSGQLRGHAASLLLAVVVPSLTWLIIVIWTGELRRKIRAGRHLVTIEDRVNSALGGHQPTLTWETRLGAGENPRITGRDHAIAALLIGIASFSVGIALFRLIDEGRGGQLWPWALSGGLLVVGAAAWHLSMHRRILEAEP